MKVSHFIAPALALAGSAYWLTHQNDTIEELSEKNRIIKERVSFVERIRSESSNFLTSATNAKTNDEFTLPDGSLDWQRIAEILAEMKAGNGMPADMKLFMKLQQKLMELTENELVAVLEKIDTLDLDSKILREMRGTLLSQLIQKDPLAALAALGDPVNKNSDSLYWIQKQIISEVAKVNPSTAIAWIEKHQEKLSSTTLDPKHGVRMDLEGELIRALLTSDPTNAKSRLENFPDDIKIHLLTQSTYNLKDDELKNMMKLARETLPSEQASETIVNALGHQYRENLEDISEFIKDLPLTQDERLSAIDTMVANYSRNEKADDKYENIYHWAQTEAPDNASDIVGSALFAGSGSHVWNDPQESFAAALTVSESLGDPSILASFVAKLSDNRNEATVSFQIQKFEDPALAEQYQALVDALPKQTTDSE